MDSKYYTPEIEEFHVGFEFEVDYGKGKWEKESIYAKPQVVTLPYMNLENIRVKHLDQEDIESLGWIFHSKNNVNNFTFRQKENSFIRMSVSYGEPTQIDFYKYIGWETPPLLVKNKSELKRLLKQLPL